LLDWSKVANNLSSRLDCVTYGNGKFVAGAYDGRIFVSIDGSNWTGHATGRSAPVLGVSWANDRFLACGGDYNTYGYLLRSTNAEDWELVSSGLPLEIYNGIADDGGVAAAAGETGSIYWSQDGRHWTQTTPQGYSLSPPRLSSLAHGSAGFLGVGRMGASVLVRSTNGMSVWRATYDYAPYEQSPTAIGSGNGRYVAVGYGGGASLTTDGLTWASRSAGTNQLLGVGYGSGTWVAVGICGSVYTSQNGLDWAAQSAPYLTYYGVAYGNDRFVIVGEGGNVTAATYGPDTPVPVKPVITTQPASRTNAVGSTATFSVAATGGSLSYQWLRGTNKLMDGLRISGATAPNLTLTDLVMADAGAYKVVVTNSAGSVTSSNATLIVITPVTITTQPSNLVMKAGDSATFKVVAAGTGPLGYQWKQEAHVLTNRTGKISGANSATLTIAAVGSNDLGTYAVVVTNAVGAVTSSNAMLSILPTITIATPAAGAIFTNPAVPVTGAAADVGGPGLAGVFWMLNGGPFQPATGTSNWIATVPWRPGTNVVTVKAVDSVGRESASAARSVVYKTLSPIALVTNGVGRVVGVTNRQLLMVGGSYKVTATPGAGQLLSNWCASSGWTTAQNPLTFMMESNLVLTANFVTNPFVSRAGIYNGLFFEPETISHQRSGFFSFTLATLGDFSGKLYLGGTNRGFAGKFGVDGTTQLAFTQAPPVVLAMGLDLARNSGVVQGSVNGAGWTAPLLGDRAQYTSARSTNYSLALLGDSDGTASPGGDGFASVTVKSNGLITVSGRVSDDAVLATPVTYLSRNGDWPLYSPLYGGKGALLGWLTNRSGQFEGTLSWIKTGPQGSNYVAGFTNELVVLSSIYTNLTSRTRILSSSNGVVVIGGGPLSLPLTNPVTLGAGNTVAVKSGQISGLVLSINPANGWVSGSFSNTVTRRRHPIKGVLLQQQDHARGYFAAPQTGFFFLEAE
jgi:hypothetical protein